MKKLTIGLLIAAQCAAQAASINGFVHHAAPTGKYELVFQDVNVLPNAFTTTSPNTLVLDFANTSSNLGKREVNIAENGIYNIDLIEGGDRTRAVINLMSPRNYQIIKRGKDVVVSFDAVAAPAPSTVTKSTIASNNAGLFNNVSNVQRNSVAQGSSKINVTTRQAQSVQPSLAPRLVRKNANVASLTFTLPASANDVQVRQDGNKVIASINGYYASKADQRRMEVDSYKTQVQSIDIFRTTRGTDLVLNIKRNQAFEFASYQNGDVYTIELTKPKVTQNIQKQIDEIQGFGPTKKYRGAPLSLNFQDIEVRAVLQIIAEFTNNNIVVSDAVAGNITLRLDNVPWDQALDIILKTKGLGMRKNGNIIYIAPASELDQREIDALVLLNKRDELVPAQTELIQVKYSNAEDLASIIEESRTSSTDQYSRNAVLSSKGTVSVDKRTNTLLVSDIPSKLQAVRDLVARLDEPVRQVLVDARLVLTTDSFASDLGSRFGITFINPGRNSVIGSGNLDSTTTSLNSFIDSGGKKVTVDNLNNRLGVNLPANASGSSYGLAILGADYLVDLELSALQTEGRAEVLSSPRIVTQDGKKARIASGQQIPYTSVSESGTNVQLQNAELSLEVTPRIAPDNRVDMILDVKKDSPNSALQSGGNIGINTNQLQTNVLVDNAETIVLGGIYEQNQSLTTDKVPLLSELPVVGNAFKKTSKKFNKSELLIFVTPRIIDNRLTNYDKFSNLRN